MHCIVGSTCWQMYTTIKIFEIGMIFKRFLSLMLTKAVKNTVKSVLL